jgi:hypothetical protein
MNKTRLCDWKIKNIRIKNKNTRCAKQMWKRIIIMLTYANMNMKRTWQGYGARLCLRLMLNRLKKMRGPTSILYPFGDLIQKRFQRGFYVYIE